jgi:hypothetical protein
MKTYEDTTKRVGSETNQKTTNIGRIGEEMLSPYELLIRAIAASPAVKKDTRIYKN